MPEPRQRLAAWVESRAVQNTIIALILINAVTLGLETSSVAMERAGPLLILVDRTILAVFVVEIGAKLVAYGGRFFRSPWNVFDFLIVAIALVPASGPLTVLRVLRVLRMLRLLSLMPRLRLVVESLLRALPGIGAIAGLMALIYYVFAVMATGFFGATHPQWFGSIASSMFTLFQIMTLESWSMGIVRPIMQDYPWAWLFFVPFILLATFTVLNLFIAIMVNTMHAMHAAEQEAIEQAVHGEGAHVETELRSLRNEIAALRADLAERDRNPAT